MASQQSTQIEQQLEDLEEENINKIKKVLKEMYHIWSLVGVDDEQKLYRANNAWGYIYDLSNELVNEENGFYEDIKERIKDYDQNILELSVELSIAKIEVDGTLIKKEEIMRKELDKLSKLKHKRIKKFQELHSVEMKYCKLLGMPPLELSSTTGVPSEKDLNELGQQVNMLKTEKEHRLQKFQTLKNELTTILEDIELSPESALEKEIIHSIGCPSLSSDAFKLLEQIVARTRCKKAELENEKKELLEKLLMLWDELDVNETEREIFLCTHNDCRVSSFNAIKQEISICEELKRQNIEKCVESLQKELKDLWEKCFVCGSDREFPHRDLDVDEGVLESYDNEVANWRQYYKNMEHIIAKIEKRQKMWELMMVFENRAADPNLLKNRSDNSLREESEMEKLQKDLPALEDEIFQDIDAYEELHGKPFLYYGEDFRVFVADFRSSYNSRKTEMLRRKMKGKNGKKKNLFLRCISKLVISNTE